MTGRVFIVRFAVRIVRSIAWSLVHHEGSPSYGNATKVSSGAPHYLSAHYLSAYSANGSKKRLRPSRFEKCLGLSVKKRTGIGLLLRGRTQLLPSALPGSQLVELSAQQSCAP